MFNLIKKGQEMIVQVTKDPINLKGAMLTTYISLPGRFGVLMPGNNTRGVSRKIVEEDERKRLGWNPQEYEYCRRIRDDRQNCRQRCLPKRF